MRLTRATPLGYLRLILTLVFGNIFLRSTHRPWLTLGGMLAVLFLLHALPFALTEVRLRSRKGKP